MAVVVPNPHWLFQVLSDDLLDQDGLDGGTERWADGRMEEPTDGRTGWRLYAWTDRPSGRRMDRRTELRINAREGQ